MTSRSRACQLIHPRISRFFILTHVLAAHLGATFFQALLDVLLLVALVVSQTSDEVVQRLFEPAHTSTLLSEFVECLPLELLVRQARGSYIVTGRAPRGGCRQVKDVVRFHGEKVLGYRRNSGRNK